MENKYLFNSIDCYLSFGIVFNVGTYNEILKMAKRKEGYTKNWQDENGTERDTSDIKYESRMLNIPITILANSESQFFQRYNSLKAFLYTAGYFNFDIVDMNLRLKLLFNDMSSFTKLTQIKGCTDIACEFTLQLIDDFPTTNLTIPV